MKIAIAGTGYVGLVTAVCLAEKGHNVTCVDINKEKIEILESGISPIFEPGLEELMLKNKSRLTYTVDYSKAYKECEVIFIGVGTPENSDGSANLTYVYGVVEQVAASIDRDCILVIKSTVPMGTNDEIEVFIKEKIDCDYNIQVASNPEFLAQGSAVRDTLNASRVVLGVEDKNVEEKLREVYKDFDAPILITNRRSAEMIKYASNNFLALKISYINEIANLCELVGADIEDVTKGMGYDTRIGDKFLNAGIGYGGSCFPKDTKALYQLADRFDYELKSVKSTIEINEQQKYRLVDKIKKYYVSFENLNIAVLGLTFKPGTDDLREAPSIVNITKLQEYGANIKAWDPIGVDNFKKVNSGEIYFCETIEETLKDTDICIIFTEWNEIKKLTPNTFKQNMKNSIVLDGRNCFEPNIFERTGVIYDSIGRKTIGSDE